MCVWITITFFLHFETLSGALAKSVLEKLSTGEWSFPIIGNRPLLPPVECSNWKCTDNILNLKLIIEWKHYLFIFGKLIQIFIFSLQPNLHSFNLSDSIRLNLMGGGEKFWSNYFLCNIDKLLPWKHNFEYIWRLKLLGGPRRMLCSLENWKGRF